MDTRNRTSNSPAAPVTGKVCPLPQEGASPTHLATSHVYGPGACSPGHVDRDQALIAGPC